MNGILSTRSRNSKAVAKRDSLNVDKVTVDFCRQVETQLRETATGCGHLGGTGVTPVSRGMGPKQSGFREITPARTLPLRTLSATDAGDQPATRYRTYPSSAAVQGEVADAARSANASGFRGLATGGELLGLGNFAVNGFSCASLIRGGNFCCLRFNRDRPEQRVTLAGEHDGSHRV